MSKPAKSATWACCISAISSSSRDAFLPGADHDGRAVGVVGADVDAPPPAEFLEPDPDVGLQVLDQVADVDMAVGVGQGAGDEDSPHVLAPGNVRQRGHSSA